MTYADTCPVSRFIFDLRYRPLSLRVHPDPVLRNTAHPVETIDRLVPDLARDMLELMRQHRGIGLAAPQVGILRRIIVADAGHGPLCLVNPMIIARDGEDREEEGCLSCPGVLVPVVRSARIEIRALDPDGKPLHFQAKGLQARVLQHEIDHLNGVVICDAALAKSASAAGAGVP